MELAHSTMRHSIYVFNEYKGNKRKREDDQRSKVAIAKSSNANGVIRKEPLVIIIDSSDEEDQRLKQPSCVLEENTEHLKQENELRHEEPAVSYVVSSDEEDQRLEQSSCVLEENTEHLKQENELRHEEPAVSYVVSSDEEDQRLEQSSCVLKENTEHLKQENELRHEEAAVTKKDKGIYLGVSDVSDEDDEDDDAGDLWTQMALALEISKEAPDHESSDEDTKKEEQLCDHSYILKDDIGYPSSYRRYSSGRRGNYRDDDDNYKPMNISVQKASHADEICAHPIHLNRMKPHQIEGFNFLQSNLMKEKPGGCILAHAPGSGKTFMIISFMQSFLAKYPDARPLVVLPKGILSTWKKEFQRWQIEDIPLLDFYSAKAENRKQQLDILMTWKDKKSILFLGYQQFATIVTDISDRSATKSCQELLLKLPSILIMDEGHFPRNKDTDIVQSLARVATPRKVVLSGTLYQNHVEEVFTILDLVRPRFMKLEASNVIKNRIMTYVEISGRKQLKGHGDAPFYELVESTLQETTDSIRKAAIIKDLRELTSRILHYYKGDFLDELPGLVDLTVLLKLTPRQEVALDKLKKAEKSRLKRSSQGSIIYVHPQLKKFSDTYGTAVDDDDAEFMDELVEHIDVQEGVKVKFFLTLLGLCEAADEKLLVFSQYLLPLRFLERLIIHRKGWKIGKEVFVISGSTSPEQREWAMEKFNSSPDAKVFFGSIKACGEGISLVGASRIIILDVHLNPSVSRQAIGRAFRPGQLKKVFAYRLVAADSPEEEDHTTCYKKELISKRWFEWNDLDAASHHFQLQEVDVKASGDMFLESPALASDVKLLQKR